MKTETKTDDTGPAFPVDHQFVKPDASYAEMREACGMSLRDYFAGQALAGFCANPAIFAPNGMNGWSLVNCTDADIVGYAYALAEKAIETRSAPTPPKGTP